MTTWATLKITEDSKRVGEGLVQTLRQRGVEALPPSLRGHAENVLGSRGAGLGTVVGLALDHLAVESMAHGEPRAIAATPALPPSPDEGGGLVLLVGDPGSGKSQLLDSLQRAYREAHAPRGASALSASEAEWPVFQRILGTWTQPVMFVDDWGHGWDAGTHVKRALALTGSLAQDPGRVVFVAVTRPAARRALHRAALSDGRAVLAEIDVTLLGRSLPVRARLASMLLPR